MTVAPPPAALVRYAREADPLLRDFLGQKGRDLRGLPLDLFPVHEAITDYVLRGGKRVRGTLVLLGCEAAGADPGVAQNASLGLELLHAYLLAHDDFMDGDELRRGGDFEVVEIRAAKNVAGISRRGTQGHVRRLAGV